MSRPSLAIVGAGPIGLEAALAARAGGFDVRVYERAPRVGGNVRTWGHVRLFTPWSMLVGPATSAALRASGWQAPREDECPTAEEFARACLDPAATLPQLASCVRTNVEVVAIGRAGFVKHDPVDDPARARASFRLLLRAPEGSESIAYADAVIDASGVYGTPQHAGDGGVPAPGESVLAARITYAIPDVTGADRVLYEGRRTLLVGAGASAATTACALAKLPRAEIVWVTRAPATALYAPRQDDPLAERVALHARARALLHDDRVTHIGPAFVDRFQDANGRIRVALTGGRESIDVDRVVVHTGFGPDNSLYRELQVHECYASRGPMNLAAALLGAGASDCLTTPAFGADVLANPEPHFFILGHKSYGTSPHFLLQTGYEQVADVVPRLAGALRPVPSR